MADTNSTTVLQDGQLAVATVAQTGTLVTGASDVDTTAVVETADGKQLCVKTFNLNNGGGGGSVTVDDELSSESENPVQNKVITTALNSKIENTATKDTSVTILGIASTAHNATNVGASSAANKQGSTALGNMCYAYGRYSTAIGYACAANYESSLAIGGGTSTSNGQANALAVGAIQIGGGQNTTANTVQIKGYQLLDADGKIPAERFPSSVWTTNNLKFTKYSYYTQFDTSKYVESNSAWGLHSANTWEFVIHYRTPSSLSSQFRGCVVATHSNSHPGINLACNYSNLFLSLGSPDSGSWLYDSSICSVNTSTDYWVRMTYGTSANTYVVTNATDSDFTENVNTQTFTSEYKVDFQEQARFGAYIVSGMSSWGDGRIYLSDCYVKADGQYVFNGADNTQYSVVGSPFLVTGVKQQVFIDNAWADVN